MNLQPKRKLTIMFDLHGVSNRMPELIKPIMKTMRACGHTVIICSGPTISKINLELNSLNYMINHHYDFVVSVVDFLVKDGVNFIYDDNGNPWTDDVTWFSSKSRIASEYNVDIVIDDSLDYEQYMPKDIVFWLWK